MAHEGAVVIDDTRIAGVDLSDSQYCAVRLDETSGKIKIANATSGALAILQDKPESGYPARIIYFGKSKAWVSGTVKIMDHLAPVGDACNDSGVLTTTTTDNDEYVAFALEAHASDTKALRTVLVVAGSHYGHA